MFFEGKLWYIVIKIRSQVGTYVINDVKKFLPYLFAYLYLKLNKIAIFRLYVEICIDEKVK